MSLSVGWRIARNTTAAYVKAVLEELQKNEEAAAKKGATQDRGRTDNTEANPRTR
jgi:hypothetical protein